MSRKAGEKEFVERIKGALDEETVRLDGQTLSRLRRIRLNALEEAAGKRRGLLSMPRWVTVGGLATAVVLVLAVSLWIALPRHPNVSKNMEDIEILTAQEHLEIYEDLEFYRWLAAK